MTNTSAPAATMTPLMDLCSGFWAFKALSTAHEIGVFDALAEQGEVTPAELGQKLGVQERPAEMLLTACAALDLVVKGAEGYANSELADAHLVSGRDRYFGGWVSYCDERLYPGWGRLTESVRGNKPVTWDTAQQDDVFDDSEFHLGFQQAMHSLTSSTGAVAAEQLDLTGATKITDVGGGTAAFAIEVCQVNPQLRATVFDLPAVAESARERIAAAECGDRVDFVEGDFFQDPLPADNDVVVLSMILHDWAPEQSEQLVARCVEALRPGGRLVVCELLVDDDKSGPVNASLMSLNMLVEAWGRNYTAAEYEQWMRAAGLSGVHTTRFDAPGANGMVIGTKEG